VDVGLLDNGRERSLGLPTRLQQRREVARVADPGHLQLHRPYPRVPRSLAVSVALPHAPGTTLVRRGSHVLLDLHLHERLGKYPNALLEEVRVLLDHRLAQQLLESYPQFIGHRCLPSVDWSLLKEPHGGRLRQQPSPFTHLRGHYRVLFDLDFAFTAFSEVRLKGVLRSPRLPYGWFVAGPPWN
jgi:hypothetical protein